MKNTLKILVAIALCVTMCALAACGTTNDPATDTVGTSTDTEPAEPEDSTSDTAPDTTPDTTPGTTSDTTPDTSPAPAGLLGIWKEPAPMSTEYDELWVFEADGTFHLYQVTKDEYKVEKSIDGTYVIKDSGEITITMMGYPLTYAYTLTDNTLTLEDHGTSAAYTRYTGKIKY